MPRQSIPLNTIASTKNMVGPNLRSTARLNRQIEPLRHFRIIRFVVSHNSLLIQEILYHVVIKASNFSPVSYFDFVASKKTKQSACDTVSISAEPCHASGFTKVRPPSRYDFAG